MLRAMATRKPAATTTRKSPARAKAKPAARDAGGTTASPRRAAAAVQATKSKATTAAQAAGASASGPAREPVARARRNPAKARPARPEPARPERRVVAPAPETAPPRRLTAGERERRFNTVLQTACLKAGTAAAISTISSKVPFLGRLAPVVLGSVGEALVLAKVQQQLVREIVELYEVELSDAEERGVVLLATAVNIGAQQISKATVEELIEQLSGRLYRPVISRVLPLASVATEVAAAVAGTYAVGKRAQALCRLPGTGAKDLSDLLRSLSGIDQARLYKWTGDAVSLALKPFRGALLAMVPGFGPRKR
jgi:uncharacterized protein (DUF697 family)